MSQNCKKGENVSKLITDVISELKELTTELNAINEKETVALKQLETKFNEAKLLISKRYADEKEVKEKGIDYLKKQIELLHKNKLDGAEIATSDSFRLQIGNTILLSKLVNKDPEFKWTADGQRKGVAQLKTFGAALAKFIKTEEKVKWDDLKKNCTIDKTTGVVHFSDATNKIEFDLAGIESKPIGLVHEISFEDVSDSVVAPESTETVDVI